MKYITTVVAAFCAWMWYRAAYNRDRAIEGLGVAFRDFEAISETIEECNVLIEEIK